MSSIMEALLALVAAALASTNQAAVIAAPQPTDKPAVQCMRDEPKEGLGFSTPPTAKDCLPPKTQCTPQPAPTGPAPAIDRRLDCLPSNPPAEGQLPKQILPPGRGPVPSVCWHSLREWLHKDAGSVARPTCLPAPEKLPKECLNWDLSWGKYKSLCLGKYELHGDNKSDKPKACTPNVHAATPAFADRKDCKSAATPVPMATATR